jgi:hypothetical protein
MSGMTDGYLTGASLPMPASTITSGGPYQQHEHRRHFKAIKAQSAI